MWFKIFCLFMIPLLSFAEPAPFNLEINKTTLAQAKQLYDLMLIANDMKRGIDIYEVDARKIDFPGVISVQASFNKGGILTAVQGRMRKSNFDHVFKTLNKKYKLLNKKIPSNGYREAQFKNGNTVIFIEAEQLSMQMEFAYMSQNLWKGLVADVAQKKHVKKQNTSQL